MAKSYLEYHAALLPLRCTLVPWGTGRLGSDLEATPERAVLMQYVDADDEATQKRFYEALLEIPWLKRNVRYAVMTALDRSQQEENTKIELARTLTLKCEVDEVKARMQADGERPPKGDLYVAAVQEVAERIGMEPEALVQRFRRLKAASTPRPSGSAPRASGV
jgi:isochorismate synthase EntC